MHIILCFFQEILVKLFGYHYGHVLMKGNIQLYCDMGPPCAML